MKKKQNQKRRDFLKMTAAGAAGMALTTGGMRNAFSAAPTRTAAGTAPLNSLPGRIVVNFNKNAPGALSTDATTAQVTIIKTMVDDAIKLLTGQTDVGAAWKSIFPSSLSLTSKILIKLPLGGATGLASAHWSSVQAITEGLQKMVIGSGTFPAANITIYDGTTTNYFASRGFTSGNFPNINIIFYAANASTFVAFSDAPKNNSGSAVTYATVLNTTNFLINVFSLRGHTGYAGNVTLGFKNHYGTFNAPVLPHQAPDTMQTLRNINCTGPVYAKNVLTMCSGLWGLYESNGPSGSPQNYSTYSKHMDPTSTNQTPTTIILGTDPVSVEMQAIKIMRIQAGKTYAVADMPDYLKASGGVVVSGTNWPPDPSKPSAMDNIGVIDEGKMKVLNILNGAGATNSNEQASFYAESAGATVNATQIEGHNCTFIEFKLPAGHVGNEAIISIFDMKGAVVRRMPRKVLGVLNNMSWNEMDERGSLVSGGKYIVKLESGSIRQTSRFAVSR